MRRKYVLLTVITALGTSLLPSQTYAAAASDTSGSVRSSSEIVVIPDDKHNPITYIAAGSLAAAAITFSSVTLHKYKAKRNNSKKNKINEKT